MEPEITAGLHVHFVAGAFDHDHVLDDRGTFDRFVCDVLQADNLASHPSPICRDEYAALGILDAFGQCLHTEATVHHRMDGPNFSRCQHRDGEFGDTAHVNSDPVSLLDPHAFQDIGKAVDLLPQTVVGKRTPISRFPLPDEG